MASYQASSGKFPPAYPANLPLSQKDSLSASSAGQVMAEIQKMMFFIYASSSPASASSASFSTPLGEFGPRTSHDASRQTALQSHFYVKV